MEKIPCPVIGFSDNPEEPHCTPALTVIVLGEEGGIDVPVERIAGAAVCLFGELPFKVIQTLQCFCHVLELKETAGEAEMSLQVARIQGYGLQAVP